MMKKETVTVIGAGLAGCEAAWQCAMRGVPVRLHEMRPMRPTPVHKTDRFAELVCSNSLRAASLSNAVGLLKLEMEDLGSLVMQAARRAAVPAGGALAVDRDRFSSFITEAVSSHPLIEVRRGEVTGIPEEGTAIVATGPLTSEALSESIRAFTGSEYLYFYDAIAPIVDAESINMKKAFRQSRYGDEEGGEYLNCPMSREEYLRFREALAGAESIPLKDFEKAVFFEGCLPVEEIARRGEDTMRFGPLKPVGLTDPSNGQRPYAVVQLRQDNLAATMFNIVGFQTNLLWPEQERVFRMIPGLEAAEFHRFGQMHRNTYINAPALLLPTFQTRRRPDLYFAGQISGVEGYVESAASGLMAGMHAARRLCGEAEAPPFPATAAMGALSRYISQAESGGYQPMKMNWGIFPALDGPPRDKLRRKMAYAERARADFAAWKKLALAGEELPRRAGASS